MKVIATNKSAAMNYELIDTFEAGISLLGPEVKSLRAGHAVLLNSFVSFRKNEAFLLNANIASYDKNTVSKIDENRTRKLLLKRNEILKLINEQKKTKFVLIPTSIYLTSKGKIKVGIALAKPLKKWDKREKEKEKDSKRYMGSF